MKLLIPIIGNKSKVILENGQDITNELKITKIEVIADTNGFTKAILTIIPDLVEAEIEEGLFKDQLIKLKAVEK